MRAVIVLISALAGAGAVSDALAADSDGAADDVVSQEALPVLTCSGSEPFWTLRLDGEAARWRELGRDDDALRVFTGSATMAELAQPPLVIWRGRAERGGRDLVVVVTAEACGDGASETAYGYRARLSLPDDALRFGCCREGVTPPALVKLSMTALPVKTVALTELANRPEGDWSRHFADLRPAIDACLQRVREPVRVLKAWPMNHGMGGVRLDAGGGERADCVASLVGDGVDSLDWLGVGVESLPGEREPLLTPAVLGAPPTGGCYETEEVIGPHGAVIGWLSYKRC